MSYLDEIKQKYDIKDHVEPKVVVPNLPTEGIVLIVGTSGSGKTTILNSVFEQTKIQVNAETTVIENFSTAERGEELLLSLIHI